MEATPTQHDETRANEPMSIHNLQVEMDCQLRGKKPDMDAYHYRQNQFARSTPQEAMLEGRRGEPLLGREKWLHADGLGSNVSINTNGLAMSARTAPNQAHLTGPVQFFIDLLDTWKLNTNDATVLLGMDPDDTSYAEGLFAGRVMLKGRDVKDRIATLYQIRKILSTLFRDEEVENHWLRESHQMLDMHKPMDLMLDGSMDNLLLVKEYVEAAAGL